MLTLASLALTALLSTSSQAPIQISPQPPQLVLHSLRDVEVVVAPDGLRARIEAARARVAPPGVALPDRREQQRLLALRPAARGDTGSVGRRAALGVGGYTSRSDIRLGSAGRREFLSRAPLVRRGRR